MGLTIHYTIGANTQEQVVKGLEELRSHCLKTGFEEVGKVHVKEITEKVLDKFWKMQEACSYPNNSVENLNKRDSLVRKMGFDTWELIMSRNNVGPMISLSLWPGEGCESCDIMFFTDDSYSFWKNKYIAKGFCKTEYAEEFEKCHLLVCDMLEKMDEMGFRVKVNDEGDYFKTKDIKSLARAKNISEDVIKSVAKQLRQAFGEEEIVTAVDIG